MSLKRYKCNSVIQFQNLELELNSSKTQILDSKKNLDKCESKLNQQIESEKDECDGIIRSATKSGIPQYGPTRGDRCLSSRDDEYGKYSLHRSFFSYNTIEDLCAKSPGSELELLLIKTVSS